MFIDPSIIGRLGRDGRASKMLHHPWGDGSIGDAPNNPKSTLDVHRQWEGTSREHHGPWRIHGAAIYGVSWILSIYPLYVSVYIPYMDPMGIFPIKKGFLQFVFRPIQYVAMIVLMIWTLTRDFLIMIWIVRLSFATLDFFPDHQNRAHTPSRIPVGEVLMCAKES